MTTILWLRQDLRLADQPALAAAGQQGPVVPIFVLDDVSPGDWKIGGAQRWWLHHSLAALAADFEARGSSLILRRGECADVLAALAGEVGATSVHALRHYEPWWIEAERRVADRLDLVLHDGNQLAPPRDLVSGSGKPYKIYSPFWRALQAHLPPPAPVAAPAKVPAPEEWPVSETLADWRLLPTKPDWATGFGPVWRPGEAGAADNLARFLRGVPGYLDRRNMPSEEGTSRLSPHLHWGEISPATVYHQATDAHAPAIADKFLKELAWRDFTTGVAASAPTIGDRHAREDFERFPWRQLDDPAASSEYDAWRRGRTGYPIVDAGMRQLWQTGWMHNRVRMIAASFSVKHLLLDWRIGARYFWDTLVDADFGNNAVNWQWIAGTGFDANQFARIMAPLTQSAKFDAAGYIRQWVPELSGLTEEEIHDPDAFDARPADYPAKIIGHKEGRARALKALASTRA
ncbi:MAG TPA: deoxyribodipyrimidine photo-lyase [Sphingomonadaceae bacterium]|nr:deoxyribodipyrimidine photo-lyase [Sphingomonadaceae bacterium]